MVVVFLLNAPAPPQIYTLSLHDALPISRSSASASFRSHPRTPHARSRPRSRPATDTSTRPRCTATSAASARRSAPRRSEEHTSELQSHVNLVCRLLLEKKNNK